MIIIIIVIIIDVAVTHITFESNNLNKNGIDCDWFVKALNERCFCWCLLGVVDKQSPSQPG